MSNTKIKPGPLAKYATARANLILMIALTLVNVILAAIGSDSMMLFSATVPYIFATIGMIEELSAFFVPGIILALINIGIYFLCWIFSKKHYGWMIAALVLFSIDTLIMAAMYLLAGDFSGIIDVAIHIWVLYYLVTGVISGHKLRNLTEEDLVGVDEAEEAASEENRTESILNGGDNSESL